MAVIYPVIGTYYILCSFGGNQDQLFWYPYASIWWHYRGSRVTMERYYDRMMNLFLIRWFWLNESEWYPFIEEENVDHNCTPNMQQTIQTGHWSSSQTPGRWCDVFGSGASGVASAAHSLVGDNSHMSQFIVESTISTLSSDFYKCWLLGAFQDCLFTLLRSSLSLEEMTAIISDLLFQYKSLAYGLCMLLSSSMLVEILVLYDIATKHCWTVCHIINNLVLCDKFSQDNFGICLGPSQYKYVVLPV